MRRTLSIALLAAVTAIPTGCASSSSPAIESPTPSSEGSITTQLEAPSDQAESAAPDTAKRSARATSTPRDKSKPEMKPAPDRGLAMTTGKKDTLSYAGSGRAGPGLAAPPPPPSVAQRRRSTNVRADSVAFPPEPDSDDVTTKPTESTSEKFVHAGTNPFTDTREDALSTFAIDVDTGSYTFARQYLKVGNVPAAASVRVEEWVNAFHYEYDQPAGDIPFAVDMEAGPSPFHKDLHLVRVGVQGKVITNDERKPVHLTFLVDVSGSMSSPGKMDMVKRAMSTAVGNLRDDDSVAIVTYAGRTEEVLSAVKASDKRTIQTAITNLRTGGGTNMGSGMELAYRNANKFLGDGRMARVVVMSDGDANIGTTGHKGMLEAVKGYVSEGVTLSTVGFGTGNYNDYTMERLANAGNGNYSYIDGPEAITKVFGDDLVGTLQVIAKDVKIQVEFNPDVVSRYRLIGYENRAIADHEFRNDKVDAGEIGAGHSVTALYEVALTDAAKANDLANVRIRYKQPRGVKAAEVSYPLTASMVQAEFGRLDDNTQFATALAVASEVLRGSEYAAGLTLEDARALAAAAVKGPYAKERRDFVSLLSHDRLSGKVSAR